MLRLSFLIPAAVVLICAEVSMAQPKGFNYDEDKVPSYTLPDPLVASDGSAVTTSSQWTKQRRGEVLEAFRTSVYGRSPGKPVDMKFEVVEQAGEALDGKAVRRQVDIVLGKAPKQVTLHLLLYLPAGKKNVPVFLGLNFGGNQTVQDDPAIPVTKNWVRRGDNHKATESSRGASASRWPVAEIVKRGYGVATIYCGDIDPDTHDEFKNGVHPLYDKTSEDGKRPADAWAGIAAWAWGLSRGLDYLQTDEDVDGGKVAVLGHSRLGKTSLWAGASDPRFAIVISNNSGCGGAALSRRAFGETVKRINTSFPHWFCKNFHQYNDNEGACPVDQHQLISLVAPRAVYVASATGDQWADPRGEFLALKHAAPVYELLTGSGLPVDKQPKADTPVMGQRMGYHLRTGKHDITSYDWQRYMDFADKVYAQK